MSTVPLTKRGAELLKEEERLGAIVQPAKDRLAELLHSDEVNELRAAIKEASPQLAKVKNELARLAPPTHRLKAEEGRYEDGE